MLRATAASLYPGVPHDTAASLCPGMLCATSPRYIPAYPALLGLAISRRALRSANPRYIPACSTRHCNVPVCSAPQDPSCQRSGLPSARLTEPSSAACPGPVARPFHPRCSRCPCCPRAQRGAAPVCAGPVAGSGGARAARGPALRGRTWRRRRRRGHGRAGEEEGTEPFPTPPFLPGDAPGACARRTGPARAVSLSLLPALSLAAPPVPVPPLRPCRAPPALPGSGARPLSRCPIPLLPPALAVPPCSPPSPGSRFSSLSTLRSPGSPGAVAGSPQHPRAFPNASVSPQYERGAATNYITRNRARKKLQLSLPDFRCVRDPLRPPRRPSVFGTPLHPVLPSLQTLRSL